MHLVQVERVHQKKNNIMEKKKKIENKSHDKLVIENTMEPKIKHRKILFQYALTVVVKHENYVLHTAFKTEVLKPLQQKYCEGLLVL